MELFKLFGKLAIEGAEKANSDITNVSTNAQKSSSTIGKLGSAIQNAFKSKTIKEVDASVEKLTNRMTSQQNKLDLLKRKYADLYLTHGKNSSEAKELAAEIEKLSSELQQNKKSLKSAQTAADKYDKSLESVADESEKSSSKIGSAFKSIGAAVAAYFAVDKIKEFAMACVSAAADAGAATAQFSQVFGDLEGQAAETLSRIAKESGVVENRMKGSFTKIAAFAKTTGMDTAGSLNLADRAMVAVADSAAFYDRTLEETTESLQSFLKGNFENDAALGLSCTETTRNAAANKLYGQSFADLSEAQKQLTLLQMVEDANALSGALGQASRESDTWTNQTGNLNQAWTDFTAKLGEKFLPAAVAVVGTLAEIVRGMTEHETEMGVITIAVGTLTAAIIAYNIAQHAATIATKLATAATTAFGAVMGFVTSPITLVILAIGALIAIIYACVKHWDDIKLAASNACEWIKNAWNSIADWFREKVTEPIANFFKSMVNSIIGGINGMVSGVISGVNFITRALNKLSFDVPDWVPGLGGKTFGFNIGEITAPQIPLLEQGGVLEKGQVGLLEGNGAEAVVPLHQNKKWISAVAHDMDNVTGGSDTAIVSLLQAILEQLKIIANAGNDRAISLLSQILDSMGDDLKEQISNTTIQVDKRVLGRAVRGLV